MIINSPYSYFGKTVLIVGDVSQVFYGACVVEMLMVSKLVGAGESSAHGALRQKTVPLGRMGLPAELAYLPHASDDPSYMTGSPVCIDVGYLAS